MNLKKLFAALTAAAMLGTMTVFPASAAETETEPAAELENNNTMGTANDITLGTPMEGSSSSTTDKDYYKLTLTENGKLNMSFAIPEAPTTATGRTYWEVSLYNADGAAIRTYTINGKAIRYRMDGNGLNAGTYYIGITPDDYYLSSQTYTLTATLDTETPYESEGNDTIKNADTLPLNTAVGGCTHKRNDTDYFQFTLEEDSAVDLVFSISDIISETANDIYWNLTLYSADDSGKAIQSFFAYGTKLNYYLNTAGLNAGTYYIKITTDDYTWTNVAYTLTANVTAGADFESENNNTLKTADELPLDTAFSGTIQNSSDVDYYVFTLTDFGVVDLDFSISDPVTETTSRTYWTVDLCTGDGNIIRTFSIDGTKTNYDLTIQGYDAGTFYLRVQPDDYYYSNKIYTLTAKQLENTNWEGEFNDTMSTADTLTANTPINGRIHASAGKDYYKLTLDKGGKLDLSFVIEPNSSNDNEYWQVTLMDENGTSLLTKAIDGVNATTTLSEHEAEAGTYYVLVENDSYYYWTTQYTLTANFEEDTYVIGDVNEDTKVDASDAASLLIAAAKIGSGGESGLTETQEASADVNADTAIDATDASSILRYAAATGSGDTEAKLEDFV